MPSAAAPLGLAAMQSPLGWTFAVGGGLVAQVPDSATALAGLLVAITGLLAGGYQYFKNYLDYRLAMARLNGQDAKLASLEVDLEKAHARIAGFEGQASATAAQVDGNSAALASVVPTTRKLAEQSGLNVAIPDVGVAHAQ